MLKRLWITPLFLIGAVVFGLLVGLRGASASPQQQTGQTGQQLAYGDVASGEITEATICQYYWFQGNTGDPVTIDMKRTSGGLDGVLWLYQQDSTSDPLVSNDDSPNGGLDPQISYTLPASDWYTVAACRLDNPNMRATTGTFDLALTGPAASGGAAGSAAGGSAAGSSEGASEVNNSGGLTEGLFPSGSQPTATPGGGLTGSIFGTAPSATPNTGTSQTSGQQLTNGSVVAGQLQSGTEKVTWQIPANAGEQVSVTYIKISGNLPPQISVYDQNMTLIAQASSTDAAPLLQLVFKATGPVSLAVGRYEEPTLQTSGNFQIGVTVGTAQTNNGLPQPTVVATQPFAMPTQSPIASPAFVAPTPTSVTGGTSTDTGYMAHACQSGANAVVGRTSSTHIQQAYTAAGDESDPHQVTETTVFRTDDDLNVVITPQNIPKTATAAAVFCAPDGTIHDAGAGEVNAGTDYLLGLDWEYASIAWPTGQWYAEVYINDQLEVTLGFTVQ